MTRKSDREDRLMDLLGNLCNGVLSDAEAVELDRWMLQDPGVRRAYLDFMAVEAELHSSQASSHHLVGHRAIGPDDYGAGADLGSSAINSSTNASARRAGERSSAGPASRFGWLSIAALLLGVSCVSSLATLAFQSRNVAPVSRDVADASRPPELHERVAHIAATQNCRWREPLGEIGFGADLHAGQRLDLEAGLAEIAFASGARVILEGPASLDINDGRHARLLRGRLSAKLPDQDGWLAVRTGLMGVGDDRGIEQPVEFGLLADGRGGGEVHVFDGALDAHLLDPAGAQIRTVRLQPREAARIRSASTTVSRFQADRDGFVRSLFSAGGPHAGLYAYESFDYPAGPLSWQNGGFGWAGPWADIEAGHDLSGRSTNLVEPESLVCGGLIAAGNRAVQASQVNRIRRVLSTSIGGVFDAAGLVENRDGHRLIGREGRSIYLSFVQRVSAVGDGFYGFELHRGDGNGNRVLCVGNGAEGAGYGVTSNYNAYGPKNYLRLGLENCDANLFVVKIDFGAGDRDRVTVFRNPESLVDESRCVATAELRGNFAFDRVGFGNFDGNKEHEVDEVRIGTNYRAVTGQRDPSSELRPRMAGVGRSHAATPAVTKQHTTSEGMPLTF